MPTVCFVSCTSNRPPTDNQPTIMDIKKKINRAFELLEKFFSRHWFNPFATVYLNLRCLPLRQAVKLPVWLYGRPRLMNLSGRIELGEVRPGMVRFNMMIIGSPSNMGAQSELNIGGTIRFEGKARIRTGIRIVVDEGGLLEFGDNLILGDFINIGCARHIRIGHSARIAHRSQIFDTNYHYVVNLQKGIVPPLCKPVTVGDNCWICNTATISAGACVPDNTIISSNSLVNKDFSSIPEYSIIGGTPARLIGSGFRLVSKLPKEREITAFYREHPGEIFRFPDDADPDRWFG